MRVRGVFVECGSFRGVVVRVDARDVRAHFACELQRERKCASRTAAEVHAHDNPAIRSRGITNSRARAVSMTGAYGPAARRDVEPPAKRRQIRVKQPAAPSNG